MSDSSIFDFMFSIKSVSLSIHGIILYTACLADIRITPAFPELTATCRAISVVGPTAAFSFCSTEISGAWHALDGVYTACIPFVQLCLTEDLSGWLKEFDAEADAAGFNEIKAAITEQLAEC